MRSVGFRWARWLCVLLIAMLPAEAGWARSGVTKAARPRVTTGKDFQAVLSGQMVPLSMKLKEFDRKWYRFVAGGSEASMWAQIYNPLTSLTSVAYTIGDTIAVGGETFLMTYRPQIGQQEVYALIAAQARGEEQEMAGVTPETTAKLCLLNMRTLASLSDIRPFDLETELAEFARMGETIRSMASRGPEEAGNLRELALALQMYIADSEALPNMSDVDGLWSALTDYVADEAVFSDPDTGQRYGVNTSIIGGLLEGMDDPSQAVAFYQTEAREDGTRGVAFFDGHAERVTKERWEKLKAASGIP